ncbi:MAG: hypothetical protein IH855_08750 [Bacteroidetes bacterium]|nr:hypothetical protein [Bacteroidota bacterium]
MARAPYRKSVFVNCPFDDNYAPLFDALIFTIHDCGFVARCTLEIDDGGVVRSETLFRMMSECKYGIHDISRTELDPVYILPRFNMPFEMGVFLGACHFGNRTQKEKVCLILERNRYGYQKYCSDIAGQDTRAHNNHIPTLVKAVRDWLRNSIAERGVRLPSGKRMAKRYQQFLAELPVLCLHLNLDVDDLLYSEYTDLVVGWLDANRW